MRCVMTLLVAAVLHAAARADDVLVAVAANFAAPMTRIGAAFTRSTGHVVKLSTGPTGRLYSQIVTGGAPFQVLLAADDETPARLIASGHAVPGTAFTYATGQLVLWSTKPDLVDDQASVLEQPARFNKLAIANPKLAPYGAAAMQVLRRRGLADAIGPRLVIGNSVAQAHQFVASGNAELGFVALSQVAMPGQASAGSMWKVPASLHDPIRQVAVLLEPGRDKPAALALLAWLRSAPARAEIAASGYLP